MRLCHSTQGLYLLPHIKHALWLSSKDLVLKLVQVGNNINTYFNDSFTFGIKANNKIKYDINYGIEADCTTWHRHRIAAKSLIAGSTLPSGGRFNECFWVLKKNFIFYQYVVLQPNLLATSDGTWALFWVGVEMGVRFDCLNEPK